MASYKLRISYGHRLREGRRAAWWDFDAGYRRYIERIARHLASAETQADEVIDLVYTELYGTRLVEGVRQSKFTTYMGRGCCAAGCASSCGMRWLTLTAPARRNFH
ncbi:MAG: hypothetical protein WKF30_14725 [Pyrinomonadaceae bacterium]